MRHKVEFKSVDTGIRAKIEESIAMCTISRAKLRRERKNGDEERGGRERRQGERRGKEKEERKGGNSEGDGKARRRAREGESLIYLRLRISVSRQSVVIRARRYCGVCSVPLNFRADTRSIHL